MSLASVIQVFSNMLTHMDKARVEGSVNPESTNGSVIWITGFSGSGKTTVSKLLVNEFRNAQIHPILLDGDELREALTPIGSSEYEYDAKRRFNFAMTYCKLSNLFASQGFVCIVSTISLFREVHDWNRNNIQNYFEVFLDVPLGERQRRDPKGVYKRFDLGLENNVSGLDLAAEIPENPHMTIGFSADLGPLDQARMIFERFLTKGEHQ